MKILLVDDDRYVGDAMTMTLADAGHRIAVELDSLRGLDRMASLRPDVVIADLGLRGVDGVTMIATLRNRYPDVYVIAISGGAAGDPSFARARAAGADHCLQKPFTGPTLLAAVSRAGAACNV